LPDSTLHGSANLLVCPNLDSANIAYNLLKSAAGHNVAIGPILLGCSAPAHILTPSATVRRIVNMTAVTVVEANKAAARTAAPQRGAAGGGERWPGQASATAPPPSCGASPRYGWGSSSP